MALDTRIPLAGRKIDIGRAFSNALLNIKGLEDIEQLRPLRNRLLGAQVATAEQQVKTPEELGSQRDLDRLNSLAIFSESLVPVLESGNT